jgi:hypothetical protein
MRRLSARALLLALTVTVGGNAGAARAGPARAAAPAASANSTLLRLVALGHRQNVSYAVSCAAFGEQFTERADLRAARFSAIDNATGQLRPALIAAGELAGLPTAFIGSRGAAAHDAATVEAAMLEVGLSWGLQTAAYAARYGAALQPTTAIDSELALSDEMWCGFNNDTFSTLAVELQAYMVAGTVGPLIVPSTDPSDIAFFGDPDLASGQSVVYLPAGPQVYNTVYVFAPDGSILAAVDKHWLADLEISTLALTPGNASANMVQQLPLAAGPGPLPLCVAVCWDCFHPDVVQWLDGQSCRLMAQPSYNMQAWAANITAGAGPWQAADWSTGPGDYAGMVSSREALANWRHCGSALRASAARVAPGRTAPESLHRLPTLAPAGARTPTPGFASGRAPTRMRGLVRCAAGGRRKAATR